MKIVNSKIVENNSENIGNSAAFVYCLLYNLINKCVDTLSCYTNKHREGFLGGGING